MVCATAVRRDKSLRCVVAVVTVVRLPSCAASVASGVAVQYPRGLGDDAVENRRDQLLHSVQVCDDVRRSVT